MKRILKLLLIVTLMLSLTGCKLLDYKEATTEFDNNNFTEAITMFEALGDYKDSEYYLVSAIERQLNIYEKEEEYEEAIELLEAYPYLENNEKEIERLENSKIYQQGIEMLNSSQPQKAIEIFKSLPTNYKNTHQIINEYEIVKACKGYYESEYETELITGFSFKSKLMVKFSYSEGTGGLELNIRKTMYDKDTSALMIAKNISVPVSKIRYHGAAGKYEWCRAEGDKYVWWFYPDGSITEFEYTTHVDMTEYNFVEDVLILEQKTPIN